MFRCLRCEAPIPKPREATDGSIINCPKCGTGHRVSLTVEGKLRIFRYGLAAKKPVARDAPKHEPKPG